MTVKFEMTVIAEKEGFQNENEGRDEPKRKQKGVLCYHIFYYISF